SAPVAAAADVPAPETAHPESVPEPAARSVGPVEYHEDGLPRSLPDHLDDVEREIIRRALARTRFNRTQAAELLGISFRQLRYRMQRLAIQEPDA
ncbi:sigma-54-dependent Fis family transcriptional regulator, partial [Oxalobacteraceae bacterium OM1]